MCVCVRKRRISIKIIKLSIFPVSFLLVNVCSLLKTQILKKASQGGISLLILFQLSMLVFRS
uniref:Uncharacterized protein n=1 Tax=Arabidopsis thaliana TaxID=3702 RepID=Q8GW73_ARATH|nr:unknown protein [Arabidopsis thaliana]